MSCVVCARLFTPTRTWHRFCSATCRRDARNEERTVEHACIYCGLLADTVDHVPPRSVRQTLVDLGIASRYPFQEVRCCRECNVLLGARTLWTIALRKEYIKKRLRLRYHKFLAIPDWSTEDLDKLGRDLYDFTTYGLDVRAVVRQRLKY